MKTRISALATLILICLSMGFSSFSVSAADDRKAQDELVQTIAQALLDTKPADSKDLAAALQDKMIIDVLFLSAEQIDGISEVLCRQADVYLVKLTDGHKTYYMAIDFRTPEAVYYSNLFVLRRTSLKLLNRSLEMARKAKLKDAELMDYRHIVGELAIHYLGYRVTDALGGEALPGILGKIYRSFSIADINIDESRMPFMIRFVGLLVG